MAHFIEITDGTTTVPLIDPNSTMLLSWKPGTPERRIQRFEAPTIMDGAEVPIVTLSNVVESFEIRLFGLTREQQLTRIRNLEMLFRSAERYQRFRTGSPVYIRLRPDGQTAVFRSEILTGQVDWVEEALGLDWAASQFRVFVSFERRYFWESEAETEIPIRSAFTGGNYVTGGAAVQNPGTSGGASRNWVELQGSSVTGSLPSAIRLRVRNDSSVPIARMMVGTAYGSFGDFVLEGESSTFRANTQWTVYDSSAMSGGQYIYGQVGGTLGWNLPAAKLSEFGGKTCRVFVRLFSAGGFFLRAALRQNFATEQTATPQVFVPDPGYSLAELGAIRIPPWSPLSIPYQSGTITLESSGDAGKFIGVDFVAFLPQDGYRMYATRGGVFVHQNYFLNDDRGRSYVTSANDAELVGEMPAFGNPLLLWPGRNARLYFLWVGWTGYPDPYAQATVQIFYRERRITL